MVAELGTGVAMEMKASPLPIITKGECMLY